MKQITLLFLLGCSLLGAISITEPNGVSTNYSYQSLSVLPRTTFETIRTKNGETRVDTWKGLRFDEWLKTCVQAPYKIIRFESKDNYMVSFSKVEFDTLICWLAFEQDGKEFADKSVRIIFPDQRDMKWVRDLDRVVLEDFDPLKMPKHFEFLDARLKKETLLDNPAPFVDTKGYYFQDLLPLSARADTFSVLLYSKDGLKLSLEYPKHLSGAILEVGDGGFNLKSPQIPGGMWLKDIIFIQIGDVAMIDTGNLDALIALNRILDWKLSPDVQFVLHKEGKEERVPLNDLLANPEQLADVESFELAP